MRTLRSVQGGSANGSFDSLHQERYNERQEIGGINVDESLTLSVENKELVKRVNKAREDYHYLLEMGGRTYED